MFTNRSLRPNPFQTYRDSQTGRWITVFPAAQINSRISKDQARQPQQPPAPTGHFPITADSQSRRD